MPWGQTTAGIVVVSGIVTAVVSAVVTWIINNATSLPWLWIVVTFVAIAFVTFLGLSLFRKRLRDVIWRSPWRWVTGLNVTTRAQRAQLVAEGYEKRSAEVAKTRESVSQPVWRISVPSRTSGFGSYYWLNNHGAGVSDVTLTCDRALFILHEEVVFPGPLTPHTGKQFSGELTERGHAEGAVFTVAWRDQNGDPQSREVPLTPEGIREGRDHAFEQAKIDGLVQGRKEGRAERQAEIDAERQAIANRVPPYWAIAEVVQPGGASAVELRLTNADACGIVSDVQIKHDGGGFTFNGSTFVPGAFSGKETFQGLRSGRRSIDFDVSWIDGNSERRHGTAWLAVQPARAVIF